ncbi:MAG: TetR/AcrR family transcriptional regulator C-terminal domain-containing protein [Roseburia sp.]|nr:TetR/AcrR family transcriptional regulator C-terminal domain-containing protein [Roseburia sp.]
MPNSVKVTEFLKECIADAILKLLETKPIDKITANEISELSGVGRATYFRYFKSKTEPLVFKLNKMWERWANEHGVKVRDKFDIENGKTYFEYHLSIKDITSLLYRCGLQRVCLESIYKTMSAHGNASPPNCYADSFYALGLYGILDTWIKRGYAETPDEMLEYIRKFASRNDR